MLITILMCVRPLLEYCVQLCSSQYKRKPDTLERVHRRYTWMFKRLEYLCCEEKLGEFGEDKAQVG